MVRSAALPVRSEALHGRAEAVTDSATEGLSLSGQPSGLSRLAGRSLTCTITKGRGIHKPTHPTADRHNLATRAPMPRRGHALAIPILSSVCQPLAST